MDAVCPICGDFPEYPGWIHDCTNGDDLIYVATYGQYPQPKGYPMTFEKWKELGSPRNIKMS
jgi:hypothetical protein|tara:strand:- start:1175 stop:1360 length:186 start_codon:yes stop_codon:yes gene_type:complete